MSTARKFRWIPILIGALVESFLLSPIGPKPFYLTPLVLGLTYLVAAATGGRKGTLWAPGLIITCWGIGVLLVFSHTVAADFPSVSVTALGVGALLSATLPRIGIPVHPLSIAVPLFSAGLTELIASRGVAVFGYGWFFGLLLGVWLISDVAGLSPVFHRRRAKTA